MDNDKTKKLKQIMDNLNHCLDKVDPKELIQILLSYSVTTGAPEIPQEVKQYRESYLRFFMMKTVQLNSADCNCAGKEYAEYYRMTKLNIATAWAGEQNEAEIVRALMEYKAAIEHELQKDGEEDE